MPHLNRLRIKVKFWFKSRDPEGKRPFIWGWAGAIVAVPPPYEQNLQQYVREFKMANLGIAHKIKKVTYEKLGADI